MPEQGPKLLRSLLRQAGNTAQSGKIHRACSLLQKAVDLYHQLPDAAQNEFRATLVVTCNTVAVEAFGQEDFQSALSSGLAGWPYANIGKDGEWYFQLVDVLGRAFIATGDVAAAEKLTKESLEAAHEAFGGQDYRVLDLSVDLLAMLYWQDRVLEAAVLQTKVDLMIDSVFHSLDKARLFRRKLDEMIADGFKQSLSLLQGYH
ncbi:MAG: hypothetical protein ACRDHZ_02305 [Ktedonobacteraceae bacterium]